MKLKLKSLIMLMLPAALLIGCAVGCASTDGPSPVRTIALFNSSPAALERKAKAIASIAVFEVLKKHPHAVGKIQDAANDLQIIEQSPTIDVGSISGIIALLPPDTFSDPTQGFYIQQGIAFLTDDLGTVAAENPEQLRAIARGLRAGIEAVPAMQQK